MDDFTRDQILLKQLEILDKIRKYLEKMTNLMEGRKHMPIKQDIEVKRLLANKPIEMRKVPPGR